MLKKSFFWACNPKHIYLLFWFKVSLLNFAFDINTFMTDADIMSASVMKGLNGFKRINFYFPWKHKKTEGVLMISGEIEVN